MSGRPRLCIVIPSLARGGTERQVLHLVEGLAKDFETAVLCTREPGVWAERARAHAEVLAPGISSGWDPRLKRRLLKWFRSWKPEIVQTYLSGFDYAANVAARCAGVKAIVSGRRERATWKRFRHVWLQRHANRHVDAIVANCRAVAEFAAEQERETLERYTVIYNGVAHPPESMGSDVRLELTLPRTAPVVGMVANFSPDKDHALFVAMAERVRAQRPETHFVLAGDGPRRESIQREVLQRGLGDAFRFVSRRDDVFDLYRATDVTVLTSQTEGLPNVVLEAMAAARPVVAAAVGGVPEIIDDRVTGRLISTRNPDDFASAVLELIEDRAEAERMGLRAAAHVRGRFSVESMVAHHRELYLQLLSRARRAG